MVIGHLGRDAVVKVVGETSVINFSLAHTESFKDRTGTKQEKTTWVECAKWGDNTAVAAYLNKGGQVFVEGTPEIRMFEKTDGTNGTSLVLRVLNLQLLGSGKGGAEHSESSNGQAAKPQAAHSTAAGAGDQTAPQSDGLPF
jgi:single-strand DNA-binding protein